MNLPNKIKYLQIILTKLKSTHIRIDKRNDEKNSSKLKNHWEKLQHQPSISQFHSTKYYRFFWCCPLNWQLTGVGCGLVRFRYYYLTILTHTINPTYFFKFQIESGKLSYNLLFQVLFGFVAFFSKLVFRCCCISPEFNIVLLPTHKHDFIELQTIKQFCIDNFRLAGSST